MAPDRPEIRQWLTEHGYQPQEIDKILSRLDKYDHRVNRESVFDAMEAGEFDMEALIKEALQEE